MHENNIELLREEAQRLARIEIELLNNMLSEPGVIVDAPVGEKQTYHRNMMPVENSAPHAIEVLQGELSKLDQMEMVIAVVGTMKSGKSTCINAIVGAEVLPNRNRPMTALPTLIRHTSGQTEPLLEFKNNKPVNDLMIILHEKINSQEGKDLLVKVNRDPDMDELLRRINDKSMFDRVYQGSDAIFWFLKSLNDLVRLSTSMQVNFPFADYDEIHEFPSISVEFAHLREMTASSGQLTLLDTPGPNEAGQEHLRLMLKGQLQKASAVLAVLNYGQLKCDADAQVREELAFIAGVTEGRLYALVNKFDEKDRNSDSEEEVKTLVSSDLMRDLIDREDVFPVSARWGYLANRARHEIFLHGKLPEHQSNPWVTDFAFKAFGEFWEDSVSDSAVVKRAADAIWKRSLFQKPLESVIHAAHARAAAFSVASASDKLVDNGKKLDQFFKLREGALAVSAETLKTEIANLLGDISKIESSEKATKDQAESALRSISDKSREVFSNIRADAVKSLDRYFQEGKRLERDQAMAESGRYRKKKILPSESQKDDALSWILGFSKRAMQRVEKTSDFDANSTVIKFNDANDARVLMGRIRSAVDTEMQGAESDIKDAISALLDNFNVTFKEGVAASSQKIVDDMKHRMAGIGFSISIEIPDVKSLSMTFSANDMLEKAVSEKTKSVTRSREKSSLWGRFCNTLNSDWGLEEYQTNERYFEVDIPAVKMSVISGIESTFAGLDKSISKQVEEPLKQGVADFFKDFRAVVEKIRGDIQQGLRDKEKSKAEQSALVDQLVRLRKNVPDVLKDSGALKSDVTAILSDEGAAQ